MKKVAELKGVSGWRLVAIILLLLYVLSLQLAPLAHCVSSPPPPVQLWPVRASCCWPLHISYIHMFAHVKKMDG